MKLCSKIAKIREEQNLTQEDLAEILCVSRQTVSNWENSKCFPDIETLIMLSDKFDVSLDELLKEDIDMVKKIDKQVKGFKLSKKLFLFAAVVFVLGMFTVWMTFKGLVLYYYDVGDTSFVQEVLAAADDIDIVYEDGSGNYSFGTLSLQVPSDVVRSVEDEDLQERIFKKNGVRSIWMNVGSSNVDIYHADKNYAVLGFDYGTLMDFGVERDLELVDYFKEHADEEPNIFWSSNRIKMRSLANYFVRGLTSHGTMYDKPYFVKIYEKSASNEENTLNAEGIIYINDGYWVVSLYPVDTSNEAYWIRFNREQYSLDEIKEILKTCKITKYETYE